MRRVDIALLCAACAVAAPVFAQRYNGADTFVPGKKYTCVPTADQKGWDCNESAKPAQGKPADNQQPHPVESTQVESTQAESTQAEPARPAEPTSPPPSSAPTSRSTLPSYLTSAAASNPARVADAPSTISAAAARANTPPPATPPSAPRPATPAKKATAPIAPRAVPLKPATKSVVASTPTPPRTTAKPIALRATHAPVVEAASGGNEFMALAGDRFVVEIAHAKTQRELDAVRSTTHVPSGELYELHLRQNGADAWLLLWGSFDSLEAARSARTTMSASATLGWPRRVAPLQAEARRVSP